MQAEVALAFRNAQVLHLKHRVDELESAAISWQHAVLLQLLSVGCLLLGQWGWNRSPLCRNSRRAHLL